MRGKKIVGLQNMSSLPIDSYCVDVEQLRIGYYSVSDHHPNCNMDNRRGPLDGNFSTVPYSTYRKEVAKSMRGVYAVLTFLHL